MSNVLLKNYFFLPRPFSVISSMCWKFGKPNVLLAKHWRGRWKLGTTWSGSFCSRYIYCSTVNLLWCEYLYVNKMWLVYLCTRVLCVTRDFNVDTSVFGVYRRHHIYGARRTLCFGVGLIITSTCMTTERLQKFDEIKDRAMLLSS